MRAPEGPHGPHGQYLGPKMVLVEMLNDAPAPLRMHTLDTRLSMHEVVAERVLLALLLAHMRVAHSRDLLGRSVAHFVEAVLVMLPAGRG